jgi:hypothetical protein
MNIPSNLHQKRIVVDAIEWAARLERLAGMTRFSIEQPTTRQDEQPNGGVSVIISPEVK